MLKVYVRGRKRRVWSPGTIAVSVGAHLLLLAGAVSAAGGDGHEHKDEKILDVTYTDIAPRPEPPRPVPVEPQTPPPPAPADQPRPVLGETREIEQVEAVPTELPPPTGDPVDPREYSGDGPVGNVIVDDAPPSTGPVEPGNAVPSGNGEGPLEMTMVEELPELSNRSAAERLLRQNYPPLLRDSGLTGRTVVTMIIDAEGRVEAGSVSVVETSHESFRDPAVKVAERMRFRPARLNGRAVPVIVTIPIEWKLER